MEKSLVKIENIKIEGPFQGRVKDKFGNFLDETSYAEDSNINTACRYAKFHWEKEYSKRLDEYVKLMNKLKYAI